MVFAPKWNEVFDWVPLKMLLDLAWGVNTSSFQLSVFTEFVKCAVGSKQELKLLREHPFACFL